MIFIEPVALGYPKEQIYQQLQRIFSDPLFVVSDILKRFLGFITQETIEGRANQIKEYTIGLSVLRKPFGFNPKEDAIVRIHAGRLRRALHQYYKNGGTRDPIHISIPTGRYVPVFSDNGNIKPEVTAKEHAHLPLSFATKNLTADCIITGEMQYLDDRLQIRVQMINRESGEQIWNQVVDYQLTGSDIFDVQDDVAKKLISAVGDYCRSIKQQMSQTSKRAVA